MKAIQKIELWSNQHHPMWIDAFRILLGVTLYFKGLLFLWHTQELMQLIQVSLGVQNALTMALIIAFLHVFFGTLILMGLGTRVSCLVMMPIVVTGTFFVIRYSTFPVTSDVILSLVVFFLLAFFFVEGSGKFSVQHYIGKSKRSRQRITAQPRG